MAGPARPLEDGLHRARLKRNSLAGTVRQALTELSRTPVITSPDARAKHERECLRDALAALLRPAPEIPTRGLDAEIATAIRAADRLDRTPTCEELLELHK